MPLAIVGGALLGTTLGTEIMLGLVVNGGGDLGPILDAAEPWANGMYGVAGLAFSLALLGIAIATFRAKPLGGQLDAVATVGLVTLVVANWVPHSIVEYVAALASAVALWPFVYRMWGEADVPSLTAPSAAPA